MTTAHCKALFFLLIDQNFLVWNTVWFLLPVLDLATNCTSNLICGQLEKYVTLTFIILSGATELVLYVKALSNCGYAVISFAKESTVL